MPQIFIGPENFRNDIIVIEGDDYHHLSRVRRVKAGDLVTLRDRAGSRIISRVIMVTGSSLELRPLDVSTGPAPVRNLVLCAGLLKGKKMDLVVQKCTELGVGSIIPFTSRRTVSMPGEREADKVRRWRKIAEEASKQSMRPTVPGIEEIDHFSSLIKGRTKGVRIIASPGAARDFKDFLRAEKNGSLEDEGEISLIIGPEGGFDPAELLLAEKEGWAPLNFGFSELRAETASIALSAVILYEMGETD